MDIADLTQSVSVGTARRASAVSTSAPQRVATETTSVDNGTRALDALRVELRASLKARFFAGFGQSAPAFAPFRAPAAAEDVAGETVNAARQVADAAPGRAATSLVAFKASVSETIEAVRETFRGRRDVSDLDAVGRLINRGVDSLAAERSADAEAATRVLEVDSKVRESAAIRIRTQEGDVVTVRLRNVERLSASDVQVTGADGEATRTSLEASQSRRARIDIEGDLNEAERSAIFEVVSQASAIADEFFDGDLGAAFENASAFQFDTGQLQRVNLRFRVEEQQRVRYAEEVVRAPEPAQLAAPPAPDPSPVRPTVDLGPFINRPGPVGAPKPAEPSAPVDPVQPPVAADVSDAAADVGPAEVAEPEAPAPAVDVDALNRFFSFVADFLEQSNVAFESSGDSQRLYFSESFKLTLLRETIVTAAPAGKEDAAETAAGVVDRLVETTATDGEADEG